MNDKRIDYDAILAKLQTELDRQGLAIHIEKVDIQGWTLALNRTEAENG